jgi:hypothetical protein
MTLAGVEYSGTAGVSGSCKDAIVRLIHFGDKIHKAHLLTCCGEHCARHGFLLHVNSEGRVAIKSGFASGYDGEGPRVLSIVLRLLKRHGASITEHDVSQSVLDRLDQSGLTQKDLDKIELIKSVRPVRWFDYTSKEEYELHKNGNPDLKNHFPSVMPYAILDNRIVDLAMKFRDEPDNSILSAYRRLEGIVRDRAELKSHGAKLFSQAFQGDDSKLLWEGLDAAEQKGRANLFSGVYMAYRNKRAHHEPERFAVDSLPEFLLLNQLYILESEAVKKVLDN